MIKPLKSVISVPGPLDSDFYFDNLSEFLGSWNSKKSCCSLRVERKAASANTLVYHVILIRKDPSNSGGLAPEAHHASLDSATVIVQTNGKNQASDSSPPHFKDSDNPSISRAILGLLGEDDKVIGLRVKNAHGSSNQKTVPSSADQVESLSASITRETWEKITGKYWFGFPEVYRSLLDSGRMLEPFVHSLENHGFIKVPEYTKHLKQFISKMDDMSGDCCAFHVDEVKVAGNLRAFSIIMLSKQEPFQGWEVIDQPVDQVKFARLDAATVIVADKTYSVLDPLSSWPSPPVLEWGGDLIPTTKTIGEVILGLLEPEQVVVGLETSGAEGVDDFYFSVLPNVAAVSERLSRR